MYHEKKIINGKLCWRGTPDGEWTEYTAAQLTKMLFETELQLQASDALHRDTLLEKEMLLRVAAKTISENLHLTDGDVCTLKELREAVIELSGRAADSANAELSGQPPKT